MRKTPIIVGAAVLFLGWIIAGPNFIGCGETGAFLRAKAEAKEVGMAVYQYANDHQGRLPKTLQQLIPNYLVDGALLTHIHLTMPGVLLKDLPPQSILLVRTATKGRETRLVFVRADIGVDLERRTKSK